MHMTEGGDINPKTFDACDTFVDVMSSFYHDHKVTTTLVFAVLC